MILMQHMSIQHIGDSFEATMRMVRETGDIVVGIG